MRPHQIDSSLFFAAYGERTVAEVKRSLALRTQVIEFALRAQGLARRRAAGRVSRRVRARDRARPRRGSRASSCAATGCPSPRYLFLRIDDAARAAALARRDRRARCSPRRPGRRSPSRGSTSPSATAGLRALALPDADAGGLPGGVPRRAWRRARTCSATEGDSAPANWEAPFGTPDDPRAGDDQRADREALDAHDRRLRAGIERIGGLTVVYDELGAALPDGREHFGYADGFAQPVDRGQRRCLRSARAGRRIARWRLAADPRRRVHPRLSRRGGRAARPRRRRRS